MSCSFSVVWVFEVPVEPLCRGGIDLENKAKVRRLIREIKGQNNHRFPGP